ncbi:MAG: hypothetical protein WCB19_07640 [Thermoplasmata archaeon]
MDGLRDSGDKHLEEGAPPPGEDASSESDLGRTRTVPPQTAIVGSDEIVLSQLSAVLGRQLDNFEIIGTRTITLLSILVGTLTGVIALQKAFVKNVPAWPIVLASALILIALAFGAITFFRLRAIYAGPEPEGLATYVDQPPQDTRRDLISEYVEAIGLNEGLLSKRQVLFQIAAYLLWLAAVDLIVTTTWLYLSGAV